MVWRNSKNRLLAGSPNSNQNRRNVARLSVAKPRPRKIRRPGRILRNAKHIRTKFAWSFWGQRIIKAFMRGGKKKVALRGLSRSLILLRTLARGERRAFGLLFEAIEAVRPILYSVERARGRRKVITTRVLPWWKQYAIALRWFRQQLANTKARSHMPWALAAEVRDCLTSPDRSRLVAKRHAMYELASRSRIRHHFRW